VTTNPYRFAARKDWKMSAEYRAYLKGRIRPPLGWLPIQDLFGEGRRMFRGAPGTIVSFPENIAVHASAQPFFHGAVCVLTGVRTFSSAMLFADAAKTYHLATVIGEETGGKPNGFGEAYPFRLLHSQLYGQVSSALFVRANGDTKDHRGVVPTVIVSPTAADRAAGRDVVLERARRCMSTAPD
jgi:C-terminal processing protease CtpA/Prc